MLYSVPLFNRKLFHWMSDFVEIGEQNMINVSQVSVKYLEKLSHLYSQILL